MCHLLVLLRWTMSARWSSGIAGKSGPGTNRLEVPLYVVRWTRCARLSLTGHAKRIGSFRSVQSRGWRLLHSRSIFKFCFHLRGQCIISVVRVVYKLLRWSCSCPIQRRTLRNGVRWWEPVIIFIRRAVRGGPLAYGRLSVRGPWRPHVHDRVKIDLDISPWSRCLRWPPSSLHFADSARWIMVDICTCRPRIVGSPLRRL